MRKAFNFYRSYYDVIEDLEDKHIPKFIKTLMQVQFLEIHIDKVVFDDKFSSIVWKSIKHSIHKQIEGYCNSIREDYESFFIDKIGAYEGAYEGASVQGEGEVQEEEQVQGEVNLTAPLRSANNNSANDEFFEAMWKGYTIDFINKKSGRVDSKKADTKKRFNTIIKHKFKFVDSSAKLEMLEAYVKNEMDKHKDPKFCRSLYNMLKAEDIQDFINNSKGE